MSMFRRLKRSQLHYRGDLACAMTSCYMALGCLADPRLQSALLSDESLEILDLYLEKACEDWNALENQIVYSSMAVLELSPLLSKTLRIARDCWACLDRRMIDETGELVYEKAENILRPWLREPDQTCCIVCDGLYTFVIVPPFAGRPSYAVIDTHYGAAEARRPSIPGDSLDRSTENECKEAGLVWTTFMVEEVIQFVEHYCQRSQTVDLTFVQLKG